MNETILKKLPIIITLILISSLVCTSQNALLPIDSLVNYTMTKFNVAGVAVGIVKDGNIIHSKGYGVKSIKTKTPVDEHINFAIASNSKAFTTTALAILVEEGKLNWEDKVKDHIPEFKMYNAYVTDNFNIQDLLTHRSGLGLGIGDLMLFPDGADFTINDILNSFQYFKPVSAFRTKFDYDNLLYLVAGEVIKRVSGMSWEKFVKNRIFEPLQMDNTYAGLSLDKERSNLATPHISKSGALKLVPDNQDMINGAAGGIYSNVDDLCNWMLLHLNKGNYGDSLANTLFTSASQREMWKIHTVLNANPNPRYNSHFAGYGLGWYLRDIKGKMMVNHSGGLTGMLSFTAMIPDINLGIVVLTNTSPDGGGAFQSITRTIVDHYLGLDNFDWPTKIASNFESYYARDSITQNVWKVVQNADDSNIDKNDYIGIYQDNWFGKMEIFDKEGMLWIKSYRSPRLNGAMHFYKANSFAVEWEDYEEDYDAFAIFNLDEEGKAQSIKMKGVSPNIDFSFDFHDLDLKRIK